MVLYFSYQEMGSSNQKTKKLTEDEILSKRIIRLTRNWSIKDWRVFRNSFWKSYYSERNGSKGFKKKKIIKIKEFNER